MKEALEHYTKVLKYAPMSVNFLVKAAQCALELEDSEEFDSLSHRIFKIDSKNPMYLMLIGLDAFKKNDLSLAQTRFKKCSSTNNKCMRLLKATKKLTEHRSAASRLIREKKYDDAAPHMSQCLSIVKDYAGPETNVSLSLDILNVKILLKKGKQNEALKTLDTLIRSYPNNTELRLDRGEILIELEDYDGAIADLSVVSRKDPNNRRAQAGLKKASELRDKERHQNYYDILGVKKGCSEKELKDAFRKCVNKWHPDRHKDPMKKKEPEKKMKLINKAMDVLGDKEKRKMYDAGYDPEAPPPPPDDDQNGYQRGGQQYYQQAPGGGQQFFQQGGFGGADFSKIFQQMMGGQGGGQQFFQQGGRQQQQRRQQNNKQRRK
jgi:tetratricopeptide (TPR) repeat protein